MDAAARPFARLAALPGPPLAELALALEAAFGEVTAGDERVLRDLDALAVEVRPLVAGAGGDPAGEARALALVLGERHGFAGDADDYDAPRNSFLGQVVTRRRGLPILLSVVWLAVAERAGVELAGVGLPGHFVVAHVGAAPPLLLDPFRGGCAYAGAAPAVLPLATAHDIALRMLTNLVGSYARREERVLALRAAQLRLLLPAEGPLRTHLEREAQRLAAPFN